MQNTIIQPNILIVDDEPVNRSFLGEIIKREGYVGQLAASAPEAQEMLAHSLPDLILLDVMMPGMDGFELTRLLRQEERTRYIPIILVTALQDRDSLLQGLEAGADDYVTKPVNRDELRLRMRNLLRLKQYHDQIARHNEVLEDEVRKRAAQMVEEHGALKEAHKGLQDAQEQLIRTEKLAGIGQLAAGVAHEINNPVGYISSNLQSMKLYVSNLLAMLEAYAAAEPLLPEDAPERVHITQLKEKLDLAYLVEDINAVLTESEEGVKRVKSIVQDLKEFAHLGSGEFEWADLQHGLESTLNVVHSELKYKAEVVREYGDLPEVLCLPAELGQVWMNLLVNAAHAIPERGTIVIRTGRQGDAAVWIEIEDTGSGIKPEHRVKIFDPFFTTKPVGKGTGLGLSISHGIIQKHGGSIDVSSEMGKGTRFRIVLPIDPSAREDAPVCAATNEAQP